VITLTEKRLPFSPLCPHSLHPFFALVRNSTNPTIDGFAVSYKNWRKLREANT
jgi:hypothetical protein